MNTPSELLNTNTVRVHSEGPSLAQPGHHAPHKATQWWTSPDLLPEGSVPPAVMLPQPWVYRDASQETACRSPLAATASTDVTLGGFSRSGFPKREERRSAGAPRGAQQCKMSPAALHRTARTGSSQSCAVSCSVLRWQLFGDIQNKLKKQIH